MGAIVFRLEGIGRQQGGSSGWLAMGSWGIGGQLASDEGGVNRRG